MNTKHRKKRISDNRSNYADINCDKEDNGFFKVGLIAIICAIIALCNYYHASYMQENHVMFSHLSTMEREMSFRTEMGFYYSFFKQVIEAPSLQASLHLLTSDNLTEYPLTINALHRFNIYPELTIGIIYRAYIWICDYYHFETRVCYSVNRHKLPQVQSCEGLGEPAIFYVNVVMLLNGVMLSFLFLIAHHVSGGSIAGGLISTLFYFYNHRECTRVQWTPPLRESFSYPFLLMQQWFLLKLFAQTRSSSVHSLLKYGYLVTCTLALLSWQFAQFALLTQTVAIYISYVVAGDARTRTATVTVLSLLLVADIVNLVLQLGNTLLLVGPLRPCLIVALALVTLEPASLRSRLSNRCWAPIRWIVLTSLLLASTWILKYAFTVLLRINSDDHMLDILRSKFSNFRSFDSLLYTCAPEFDFYDISSLIELTYTGLVPIFVFVMATVVLYTLMQWYLLCRLIANTTEMTEDNFLVRSGFIDIGTYFHFFQTVAFTIMAALIMRLKLFWTPQLCILASLLCHPRWPIASIVDRISRRWPLMKRLGHLWPVAVLVALCSVKGITNLKAEWTISGSYSNWDQEQLLGAIKDMTMARDSFVGQMATMATVRLVTGRSITMHPHYEDEHLRERVHIAYLVYGRQTAHRVWLALRTQLHASHLVYEQAYCALRAHRPGCSYLEMWDLVDPASVAQTPLCQLFNDHIAAIRLGHASPGGLGDIGRYFRWRFTSDGGMYTLFEVVPVPLT